MIMKRIARFSVSTAMVFQMPSDVAKIVSHLRVAIVGVEVMLHRNTVEYTGISDLFKEVAEGDSVPEVTLDITHDANGNVESVAVRYP